jgi:hypothetical protein
MSGAGYINRGKDDSTTQTLTLFNKSIGIKPFFTDPETEIKTERIMKDLIAEHPLAKHVKYTPRFKNPSTDKKVV